MGTGPLVKLRDKEITERDVREFNWYGVGVWAVSAAVGLVIWSMAVILVVRSLRGI